MDFQWVPHGRKMRFLLAIFIWFLLAQFFIKFYKNGSFRKLQDWSFKLWKNCFFRLNTERARRSQNSITFFDTPCIKQILCTYLDLFKAQQKVMW